MSEKQRVWQPDKSRAPGCKEQERGRGSYKQSPNKPPKKKERKMPVVPDSGYSTIESVERCSLLDYTALVSNGNQGLSCPDFCGWQDKELVPLSTTRRATPGLRNTMLSRLETRSSQRHRDSTESEFQPNILEAHAHMEHYRTHYCYSTLTCLSQERPPTRSELVDQGKQLLLKLEVKSLCRGDVFLRELASRLGVVESIKEPHLLRHTPPSIVKKPRNKADLSIDLTPKPLYDEGEDDLCTPGGAWTVDSTKATPTHHPLELPKIPQVVSISHKAASSSISIHKYLRVSSQGDEESTPNIPASLSSTSDLTTEVTECTSSEQTIAPVHYQNKPLLQDKPLLLQDKPLDPLLQDKPLDPLLQDKPLVHTMDSAHKERLITATAQSLGLSSRHWDIPSSNKQLMSRYLKYTTRPATRERQLDNRQSRPSTKQETNRRQDKRARDNGTRPSTRQEDPPSTRQEDPPSTRQEDPPITRQEDPPITQEDNVQESSVKLRRPQSKLHHHRQKLDRLKSIYSQHSSTPSRPHTRPPTRSHTRPPTRAKEVIKDTLDGSSYWNELRVERSNREEVSKNETRNDGFSSAKLLSQQPKSLSGKMLKNRTKQITNEQLTPGSSPLEITRHLSKLKRKFDGALNIHKQEVVS